MLDFKFLVCTFGSFLNTSSIEMAKLKLPPNFQVQCFGFSWNVDGIGTYTIFNMRIGADAMFQHPLNDDSEDCIKRLNCHILHHI